MLEVSHTYLLIVTRKAGWARAAITVFLYVLSRVSQSLQLFRAVPCLTRTFDLRWPSAVLAVLAVKAALLVWTVSRIFWRNFIVITYVAA
jgi:hypothetical protein